MTAQCAVRAVPDRARRREQIPLFPPKKKNTLLSVLLFLQNRDLKHAEKRAFIFVSLSALSEPCTATFFFDNKKEGKKLLLGGEPWIFAITQKSVRFSPFAITLLLHCKTTLYHLRSQ
ncbi:MAG: hypothetical protein ACI4KH_09640 [Oscillospiraceae bacterium]